MNAEKITRNISRGLILLSATSLFTVSAMAFNNPQSVMDLVSVELHNNDAYSSIRGVYGGVGLTLFILLLYTMRRNLLESLGLLSILWGLYALSRIMTIYKEGPLGSFGTQWLLIESVFFLTSITLYFFLKKQVFTRVSENLTTGSENFTR